MKRKEQKADMLLPGDRQTGTHVFDNNNNNNIMKSSDREIGNVINAEDLSSGWYWGLVGVGQQEEWSGMMLSSVEPATTTRCRNCSNKGYYQA